MHTLRKTPLTSLWKRWAIPPVGRSAVAAGVVCAIVCISLSISARASALYLKDAGPVTPTPTAPSGANVGLSATSGPPGTHVFIAGSGYTAGEKVQERWNYTGPGTGVAEKSFYKFNPIGVANAQGVVNESIWTPLAVAGTYTIAAVGLTSGIVKTATFQQVPALDPGTYIGPTGTVLHLHGWGFGYRESVSVYWDGTPATGGTLILQATTDAKGDFSGRNFTVPGSAASGAHMVYAVGLTTGVTATVQFTVGAPSLSGAPASTDWANWGFDLQNTRVNPTETVIGASDVATLAVKWRSPTPVPYTIVGSPVIANGIVYVGSVEGTVSAYTATTGALLWTFYATGPIYSSPTIVNGIAYFGSVNYPSEDLIGNYAYALNATSGALIWDNYLGYGGEWVPPVVTNGIAYFSQAHKEGSSGGYSAFNASNGAPVWGFATPYGIWSADTLDPSGQNLYVGTGNPCLSSGGSTCAGYMEDLNPSTGATLWQIHFPDISGDDDVPTSAVYNNGRLYIGLKNGLFYCLDATNGSIIWQYNTGSIGDYGIYSSAAFYGNLVIFGGGDHLVHALNIANGSLAWTFTTGSLVTASPSIANGVLYIGSLDKHVYALNPLTGVKLWQYTTGGAVYSSPIVSSGVLYEASSDGYLYAFTPGGV